MVSPEKIANEALNFLGTRIPQKCLPTAKKEWTVYSAILQENSSTGNVKVVACGTGSKCLGRNEISLNGDLIHDSHAEVIARRSFHRYLINRLDDLDLFIRTDDLFQLNTEVKFHLFSTHPPCGSATIVVKEVLEPEEKRPRLDLQRTGGKCVDGEEQDEQGEGVNYHTAWNAIRTKPGRGDPTKSLSCSDKLVKWNFLGWQGAMLASVLKEPIFMSSLIFLKGVSSQESIQRALVERFEDKLGRSNIDLHLVDLHFPFMKREELAPNPCSVIFSDIHDEKTRIQVSNEGRKQGCIKKHHGTEKARVKICRLELAIQFIDKMDKLKIKLNQDSRYCDLKANIEWYTNKKCTFLRSLPNWPIRDKSSDEFEIPRALKPTHVLLLKAQDSNQVDPYDSILRKSGYRVTIISPLSFEFCDPDQLRHILTAEADLLSGLILTSPRAVEALAKYPELESVKSQFEQKRIYVVGEKTSKSVRRVLGLEAEGADCGNAANLARVIKENLETTDNTREKNFLAFLCGDLAADDVFRETLSGVTIVKTVIVYKTVKNPNLDNELSALISENKPDIIAYFSPSGVEFSRKILENLKFKTLALGPSTERALNEANLIPNAICNKPNPYALLQAIKSIVM